MKRAHFHSKSLYISRAVSNFHKTKFYIWAGFESVDSTAPLTAEDIWFLCDLPQQFIPPINLWKKCNFLRLFSKCLVGSFLRSKEVNGGHMVKEQDFEVQNQ